ncbi:MAG: TrkH family potassium uptake protein [Fusobacteriota bacterium]
MKILKKSKEKRVKLTPSQILVSSFLIIIAVASIVLMLPIATPKGKGGIDFLTSLFTITSAVSVTGLSVVDVSKTFSIFGKTVIMIVFQLGGLGIMTFSSLIMYLIGKKITYQEKRILQEDLNQEKVGGILHFMERLAVIVITIEGVGALLLFSTFRHDFETGTAIYYAIFHSISAFCNAGFSLFTNSFEIYSGDITVNLVISSLIILGGIGFAVINSSIYYLKTGISNFSLTSKVALKISAWLLLIGTLFIFFTEYSNLNTIGNFSLSDKLLASYFQSVTTRTAGFNTISMGMMTPSTIFMFLFLMFVGASPGSTGGGIKTTTFGVIFYSVLSTLKNKKDINVGNRRVSWHILNRAIAILFISLLFIFLITLSILIVEGREFVQVLFEVVSAFGTVGLSMGITSSLSDFSRVLIIITMLVGRVGPLTAALAFGEDFKTSKHRYPEENILVG